eukprot:COSAG05_NODE_1118_length_5822_cov_11.598288_5_plen_101_part_00
MVFGESVHPRPAFVVDKQHGNDLHALQHGFSVVRRWAATVTARDYNHGHALHWAEGIMRTCAVSTRKITVLSKFGRKGVDHSAMISAKGSSSLSGTSSPA